MVVIRDRDGNTVQTSRNLRGIRTYAGKNIIKVLSIDAIGQGEGKLCILFVNGNSCETNFASFEVLRLFVRNWRNTYGAPLRVNGVNADTVWNRNPALAD